MSDKARRKALTRALRSAEKARHVLHGTCCAGDVDPAREGTPEMRACMQACDDLDRAAEALFLALEPLGGPTDV